MAAATAAPPSFASATAPSGWPVWGHDSAVDSLKLAVVHDRVRHAYLFGGPDGVGKTALAHAFAQVLCCQASPGPGLACGDCLACGKINRGVHPDVRTFSLASQQVLSDKAGSKNTSLTIDTVRELAATVALRPMEGRWRVLIVEDAETLPEIAQEALLKTLEEPPSFIVLILLANDSELLLPTIRSRCQVLDLRPANREAVRHSLLASGLDSQRSEEIAALAGGRPGWAHRAATDPKLIERRREAFDRAVAWIEGSAYDRLVAAVRLADAFPKRRPDVFADIDALLGVWRDALLLHAAQPHYLTYRGKDNAERLSELARGWELADLHRAVCSVQTCLGDLEANVRPRLAMETMVLQWPIVNPKERP